MPMQSRINLERHLHLQRIQRMTPKGRKMMQDVKCEILTYESPYFCQLPIPVNSQLPHKSLEFCLAR